MCNQDFIFVSLWRMLFLARARHRANIITTSNQVAILHTANPWFRDRKSDFCPKISCCSVLPPGWLESSSLCDWEQAACKITAHAPNLPGSERKSSLHGQVITTVIHILKWTEFSFSHGYCENYSTWYLFHTYYKTLTVLIWYMASCEWVECYYQRSSHQW